MYMVLAPWIVYRFLTLSASLLGCRHCQLLLLPWGSFQIVAGRISIELLVCLSVCLDSAKHSASDNNNSNNSYHLRLFVLLYCHRYDRVYSFTSTSVASVCLCLLFQYIFNLADAISFKTLNLKWNDNAADIFGVYLLYSKTTNTTQHKSRSVYSVCLTFLYNTDFLTDMCVCVCVCLCVIEQNRLITCTFDTHMCIYVSIYSMSSICPHLIATIAQLMQLPNS